MVDSEGVDDTGGMLCEVPAQDLDRASEILAEAFEDNPAYQYVSEGFSDSESGCREYRRGFLRFFFQRNLEIYKDAGIFRGAMRSSASSREESELACFFLLRSPAVEDPKLFSSLCFVFVLVWRYGLGVLVRLLRTKDWYEAEIARVCPEPHYLLERMAVVKELQRTGIGSACLSAALDEARKGGLPVFLVTQEDDNVKFYSKLGFRLVSTNRAPFANYMNYYMILPTKGS